MSDEWTASATDNLRAAQTEARRRRHSAMEPEHLLWADLRDANGLVAAAAKAAQIPVAKVKAVVDQRLIQLPVTPTGARSKAQFSDRLKELFTKARGAEGRDPQAPLDWPDTLTTLMARYDDPLIIGLRDIGFETARLAPPGEGLAVAGQQAENILMDDPLRTYCRDLTAVAKEGRIEPVIGREAEIEQVILILSQRTTNNPVLLGEPGVGKTAIVEGLACKIAGGEVPRMADQQLLELDLNALLAGASYRGEFEERLKRVVDAVVNAQGRYVLFVDEIHTLMGAGQSGGGPDAANLLKPPLARGQLRMIGATTYSEYKQHLERDAAFTRRFQTVTVPEPTREQVRGIMAGISGRYEAFHGVEYDQAALDSIVELADRYIGTTHFPDKAIKVIDRAGVIAVLKQRDASGKRPRVDAGIVVEAVAQISNLPSQRIAQGQEEQISAAERVLNMKIVGQTGALAALVRQLRSAFSPLRNPNRPRGVLMFTGPAAVGKSATARILAGQLYASEQQLTVLDMAGFAESYSVSQLIGSSIGLEGSYEGGRLTEAVWRAPFHLVLLEQIDLAHEQVLNVLATAFRTGELADSRGKRVRMTECLFLMTSRLPAEDALPAGIHSWVDQSITFSKLTVEHAVPLARLSMGQSAEHLVKSQGNKDELLQFDLDDSAAQAVREAFDPTDGALSVERYVDQQIFSELARQHGQQDWSGVRKVIVSRTSGRYAFTIVV